MNETGELPPDLAGLVASVGFFRINLGAVNAELDDLEREFRQQHAALYAERDSLKRYAEEAEAALRLAVVNQFLATNNRKPHPACSVRMNSKLVYDPVMAARWARTEAPALLVLDTKKFEKAAPNIPGAPIETIEVPVAVVATNLAAFMPPLGQSEVEGDS